MSKKSWFRASLYTLCYDARVGVDADTISLLSTRPLRCLIQRKKLAPQTYKAEAFVMHWDEFGCSKCFWPARRYRRGIRTRSSKNAPLPLYTVGVTDRSLIFEMFNNLSIVWLISSRLRELRNVQGAPLDKRGRESHALGESLRADGLLPQTRVKHSHARM